ncbi:transient receptor potential cation channel subfamily M member 3-like [Pomacea canaliculata]|uniref:transient receptor potential cation channel subfamily M member 3-like n=1 Tax=Pomacea canaliculata TaxID=400727 RepID=UPI000D72A944|nr:transient receptor potential cation channel subfamily M member 3-like [Pomacea canaliculata]
MAQFLWRDVKDRMTAALIACVTLKAMKKRILNNVAFMDEKEEYTQKIAVFEGLAVAVLNRCNNEDAEKTKKLLTRIQPQWEGLTCLEIADQAKCSNFISQESCQAIADLIWKGKDNQAHTDDDDDFLSVCCKYLRNISYVFIAFFVVIPTFLLECGKNKRSGAYLWKSFQQIVDNFPLSASSPAFKFYVNWFFFLGFVFLYMYVLLVRIPIDTLQIPELILFAWFFTLFIEELRLSIVMIPHGTKGKVSYFLLNQIGFLSITNYYLGLATIAGWVINPQSAFLHGAMCVNFIGFVCRLFFFLSINAQLGPRIFMMRRMIRDIIIFSVILIIMCFTYGVVVYSLENKGTIRDLQLSSLLELPVNGFWLLLGNQPSDNANEDNTDLRIVIRGLMRVVYMMIACILMINLLIAAFSHTFNQVQEKKEEVRKFQRFQMIYRFYYQFPFPPPLSILFYLPVAFGVWCCRCCKRTCTKNPSLKNPDGDKFHQIVNAQEEEELLAWANAVVDSYSVGSPMNEDSVQTQVNEVIRKVQRIAKSDEGLYKYTENKDSIENLRDLGEILKKLQESVQSLADSLLARPDLQTSKA